MSLDRQARVHLLWMFENQPDFLRKLLREGKLYDHLDKKLQQGLWVAYNMEKSGRYGPEEAFEVAVAEVLAPNDSPDLENEPPQRPLSLKEKEAVFRSLDLEDERRGKDEKRVEEKKSRRPRKWQGTPK